MLNRCRVHATAIILGIALIWRLSWTMPCLVANSLVGIAWMILERDTLRKRGSACLGMQVRIGMLPNILLNVITHILLPLYLIRRLQPGPLYWKQTIFVEILGLTLIDLNAVYPTAKDTLKYYVLAHVVLLTCTHGLKDGLF
jgi:hypothetical protein